MDVWFILVFGPLICCGTEGCYRLPNFSLTLSPFPGGPPLYHSAMLCRLCLNGQVYPRQTFSFMFSLNGHLQQVITKHERRALYVLDRNMNSGLWRCKVKEYPELSAEYYIAPPTSVPPTEEEKDIGKEKSSVPAFTLSYRIILTLVTAVVLLIILIIVAVSMSQWCLMGQCRRTSDLHPHTRGEERSDNIPLTENLNSNMNNPNAVTDTEVSYVELEMIQKPPCRQNRNPHSTIYTTIM